MFRPSRPSSGPPRKTDPKAGIPQCRKTKQLLDQFFLEGLKMTDYVETCRPDIYNIVYKNIFCVIH